MLRIRFLRVKFTISKSILRSIHSKTVLNASYSTVNQPAIDLFNLSGSIIKDEKFDPYIFHKVLEKLDNREITVHSRKQILNNIIDSLQNEPSKNILLPQETLNLLYKQCAKFITDLEISKENSITHLSPTLMNIYVQYFTLKKHYLTALKVISFNRHLVADSYVLDLLALHLVKNNETRLCYSLFNSILKLDYPYYLSSQIYHFFIETCIANNDTELLAKFFIKYIYFTGQTQPVKHPVIDLSDGILYQLLDVFIKDDELSSFSKLVDYHLTSLKSRNSNKFTVETFRQLTRLQKFNDYVKRLGADCIANGMFHQFGFAYNTKVKVFDMNKLVYSLSKAYPNLDLQQSILLIEQMHGFHIKEHREKYSKALAPDIQMARIYRSSIKNTSDPDPTLIAKYDEIINQGKPHMHEGIPKRKSLKQRMTKIKTKQIFGVLPLNVILKVIYMTSNDLLLALQLLKVMIDKRKLVPAQETFSYIFKIMQKYGKNIGEEDFDRLFKLFHRYCTLNNRMGKLVIETLIKVDNKSILEDMVNGTLSRGYYLSNDLIDKVSKILGKEIQRNEVLKDYKKTKEVLCKV